MHHPVARHCAVFSLTQELMEPCGMHETSLVFGVPAPRECFWDRRLCHPCPRENVCGIGGVASPASARMRVGSEASVSLFVFVSICLRKVFLRCATSSEHCKKGFQPCMFCIVGIGADGRQVLLRLLIIIHER